MISRNSKGGEAQEIFPRDKTVCTDHFIFLN
jgi:hypothetical protein